jgi:hypothetical protein
MLPPPKQIPGVEGMKERNILDLKRLEVKKPSQSATTIFSKGTSRVQRWVCERFHRIAGPFQDQKGVYERCLDCGRRIPWEDPLPLRGPRQGKAA